MAASSIQVDKPPYRSFKELRDDDVHVLFSPAAKRLYWPFDGVFPTAISVMKTPQTADDHEPFFRPSTEAGGSGNTWHEISQLPLTEPKCSSIEASVYNLEWWEFDWLEFHRGHSQTAEYVTYRDLSDEDRPYPKDFKEDGTWEDDDSDTEFLIRCCGEQRPLRKRDIKLVVIPSSGSDFITVHNYVNAVHPWLMSLRHDVLQAKTILYPELFKASAPTQWMVDSGPIHMITEKKKWIADHGGRAPRVFHPSSAAVVAKLRALKAGINSNQNS